MPKDDPGNQNILHYLNNDGRDFKVRHLLQQYYYDLNITVSDDYQFDYTNN